MADSEPARRSWLGRVFLQEDINFLLTNRIPRRWATLFMGWFSKLEWRWLAALSIGLWRRFDRELDLSEAQQQRFQSVHECFTRRLVEGARPIDPDPDVVTSPCDSIVGAHGRIDGDQVIQAKGFPYSLADLLHDEELVERYRNGRFVTLRVKASMYHRFHAPIDCRVSEVNYISGDTWNVNPIALKRVERLFCKNERAVVDLQLDDADRAITLVPVAAILVAGMNFHFLDDVLDLRYRGANRIACDATLQKGEEMGFFQHGSTIIVFAAGDFDFCENVVEGARLRVGEPLLRKV